MSRAKPERDRVLGHADEADGIEEYDNPLPDWWLGLFWITIIWAGAYATYFHFVSHQSQRKWLAAEIAEAEQRWPRPKETGTVEVTPATVAAGKEIFQQNCVGCHGADGQGGIGPNLTDTVWIHGGTKADILHTITVGVPEKGMPTWGQMIGPDKVAKVAAYVIDHNGHVTQ